MKIAFIGGGNMANALINGIWHADPRPEWVRVCDPSEEARDRLASRFPIDCFAEPRPAVTGADIIVIATKPQVVPQALEALAGQVRPDQLVISIAAGVTVATISDALCEGQPVVRTMPNTPALIGKGVTGLFAGPGCTGSHREAAEAVVAAAGAAVWVEDEDLINVVTALSGSGPAYFFLLTEALREAGSALGLSEQVAGKLALHTAHGAGAMALHSDLDVRELREVVTTPGGTTQAALEVFEAGGFRALVADALKAATERGRELAGTGEPS